MELSRDEERGRRAYKEFFREQHMVGKDMSAKRKYDHMICSTSLRQRVKTTFWRLKSSHQGEQ